MKIAYISIYPEKNKKHSNFGGVASYTKNLVTNIPQCPNDKIYVLCNIINNKRESYIENNINIIRCFNKNIKFLFQILKEIKKIDPDVIHIQQELSLFGNIFTAYLLQWLLFLLQKHKIIITLHGVVSLKKINKLFVQENNSDLPAWLVKMGFYVIYKPLCVWSKKIIVHEKYFKDILINEYGTNKNKIEVIYHGVEDLKPLEKKVACTKLSLNENKNIILFMGYLTGYKGIDLLIEGFSDYCKTNSNAFLVIGAGKHPKLKDDKEYLEEYERLQNKAENLIPQNMYAWMGFIKEEEILYYYSASDVAVYPYTVSMSSSGPMAFSIGYEKPFLASDVFDKVINNKEILFKRSPKDLANKLENFFKQENRFQDEIMKIKKERLWKNIGYLTYNFFKNI